MGVKRIRVDSVSELRKRKTQRELQAENEKLQTKVGALENQLTDTQLALCDVFEQLVAVQAVGGEV